MQIHPDTLSFWERERFFSGIDIVVVGCGIVGLNAAISLAERWPKRRIVVLERGALPEGASTRNAGFACFGSLSELLDDLKNMPESEVLALVARRWRGLQRLRERVGDHKLLYEEHGGYELFLPTDAAAFEACADQMTHFNRLLAEIVGERAVYREVSAGLFNFRGVEKVIHNVAEGQIDTGEMMWRLIKLARKHKVRMIHGLSVGELHDTGAGVRIVTEAGWEFGARQVLVCTNGFARQLLPDLEVKPARNQVLITKPIAGLKLRGCFHYDRGYYYFRNVGPDRVLLGGGRNLDFEKEFTDVFGANDAIRDALTKILSEVILPGQAHEIDMWWSGIMGLGAVKKPIIEMHSPNIGVAVRMGGMGVAIGSLVGEEGAEMLAKS